MQKIDTGTLNAHFIYLVLISLEPLLTVSKTSSVVHLITHFVSTTMWQGCNNLHPESTTFVVLLFTSSICGTCFHFVFFQFNSIYFNSIQLYICKFKQLVALYDIVVFQSCVQLRKHNRHLLIQFSLFVGRLGSCIEALVSRLLVSLIKMLGT